MTVGTSFIIFWLLGTLFGSLITRKFRANKAYKKGQREGYETGLLHNKVILARFESGEYNHRAYCISEMAIRNLPK